MPKLVNVAEPTADIEESGPSMPLPAGRTMQGMRPTADDDDRYFERVTHADGRVTWLELLDD